MRQRPTEDERQAAREYLEHDYARRNLSGQPAEEAHRNAEQVAGEYPRARLLALTGGSTDLGQLPRHLRTHQLRERRAAGISTSTAAEIRRGGYQHTQTRRRTRRERAEDAADIARGHGRRAAGSAVELASDATGGWGAAIGDVFVWGAGLSIFYLLITKAAATGKLAQGASNIVRAIVSPVVDPLNPKGIA